ncbi:MAG TPA: GNAT family N-acetyltransferase [Bryobacteraceae bacterium]
MIAYEFVPFTADWDSDFCRLFANEGFERSPTYLEWAFRSTPGQGRLALALDKESGGQVVGVLAAIPVRLRTPNGALRAFQAVDLLVDPTYRGRGVFSSLGKTLMDGVAGLGGEVIWGFPNESAAHTWFQRLGWMSLGQVPYMLRPLRSGFFLGRVATSLRGFNLRLGPKSRSVPGMAILDRFDMSTDRLWEAFATPKMCGIERTASWLNWRIFDKPNASYRTVGVFLGNDILAFATSTMVPRFGGMIHHFVEALCSGPKNLPLLLKLVNHEIAYATEQGADASLCWCPEPAPNHPVYLRAGFLPLPGFLRPTKTDVGLRPLRHVPEMITSGKNWYFSLLDFDGI